MRITVSSILNSFVSFRFRTVLLSSLCLTSASFAQKSISQYVHDNFTMKEGLPQNSASSIIQSKNGYLWFATQEGLARFDGVRFTVFDRINSPAMVDSWIVRIAEDAVGGIWIRPVGFAPALNYLKNGVVRLISTAEGLPSNRSLTLAPDTEGGTWIGTDRGLSYHKDGTFTNYSTKDGLPADTVFGLTLDNRGRLWISTVRGIARFREGNIETLTGTPAFPDTIAFRRNDFRNIHEDRSGTIWLVTNRGLLAHKDGTTRAFTVKDGLLSQNILWIHEDRQGSLWLGTDRGLCRYKDGAFTPFGASVASNENSVSEIHEDEEGNLWLVMGKGIKRFSNGKFESFTKEDGLSDDNTQTMLIDREGSVWVSTFGGGVDRFRRGKFVTYSSRTGLKFDQVQPVFEDSRGYLWAGSNTKGVARLKDGTIQHFETRSGLPANDIRDIAEDGAGNIWIAAAGGLASYRDGVFTNRSRGPDPGQNILGNAMRLLRSGEFLVGSQNKVFKFVGGRYVPFFSLGNVPSQPNFIGDIWEDGKGVLWVSANRGMYRYSGDTLVPVLLPDSSQLEQIRSFFEDAEGTIWLGGARRGVYRYKNGTFASIGPKEGLFDYNAYAILEDKAGYFWMSCNKGVYRVSKQELNDVADGKASMVHCTSYGEADGMESRECNGGYSPSGFKLRDGRMAFPTVKGVAIVNPADIKLNEVPPPVVIDQFLAEGEAQRLHEAVSIAAGTQRFEFRYAGISFIGGERVRYKYKLEGQDNDWIDAGTRREAFYNNLSPGTYTFRVIAANSDGVWNEEGASATFELRPFFYQTTWFLGLGIILFLTTGPSLYVLRVRSLKRREMELEELVNNRTSELQKTLNHLKETQHQLVLSEKMASLGQLTAGIAHEIKNPLNFITNFAVLSKDLTMELRGELAHEKNLVDEQRAAEITDILDNLEQNVIKINEHGKRADSIVRGMLLHSRGKAGERQETDITALLAEYANLAYHGMRAQDQSFNVKIETDFDPAVGKMNVVPQDLSRAFLNIVNNACYAANDKRKSAKNGFSPTVRVSTRNLGDRVEIRIRDNGNGIPADVRDRIFNPFFTTKPAGIGTGLGLSLTYDIIVQEHGGDVQVDTREGEYTEFIITIPRTPRTNGGVS